MKIVNTLQHYVRFGYKTFVVDNFVLDDPSDFEEVLKDEYVYKNGKLFKALKNTISKTENLNDKNIFIEISAYSDETPETPETSKEKKDNEITENVQKSKTTEIEKTEDVKVEKVEEVATELAESTEQKKVNFNQLKSKKKR